MTISSAVRKVGPFLGDDATTVFTFSFKVFAAADLLITKLIVATGVESEVTTGFTVALNSDQNSNPGGTVTLDTALPTGTNLTIATDIPATQTTDLTNLGGFFPAVITNALDRLTIIAQQLDEQLDRSLKYPISDSSTGVELPAFAQRAGTVLAFDALGAPVAGPDVDDVGTVLDNIANIGKVAAIDADVTKVAAIDSEVPIVAAIDSDVTIAAGIASDITTVAGIASDVTIAVGVALNITTVAGIAANVTTVAGISSEVSAVAEISADVTTVAGIDTDVTIAAGIASDITTVAGIDSDVTIAAGVALNITTVAGIAANVTTVAGIAANVTTVAGIAADVATVAGIASEVGVVSGLSSELAALGPLAMDIQTVALNVADVENFADVYVGSHASDPATRTDGSALLDGDMYFNNVALELRIYHAPTSSWVAPIPSIFPSVQRFSGTGAEVNFTLNVNPGAAAALVVSIGGIIQTPNTDYTVSETTLTFTTAPPSGTNNISVQYFGIAGTADLKYGTVTLAANQATTTVSDVRITTNSVVVFEPRTANAAAEVGAGGMYVSAKTAGTSFVVTHANNAQTDRTFGYVIH